MTCSLLVTTDQSLRYVLQAYRSQSKSDGLTRFLSKAHYHSGVSPGYYQSVGLFREYENVKYVLRGTKGDEPAFG